MVDISVFVESGKRRAFAGAVDWPGWCRMGHDREGALAALRADGTRYSDVMRMAGIAVPIAEAISVAFEVEGNGTTDFGAPDVAHPGDDAPLGEDDLTRSAGILAACWQALVVASDGAAGRELRKGPRGGGRDLEEVIAHVHGAELSYLRRLGVRAAAGTGNDAAEIALATLRVAAAGQPERGPRGASLWTPRRYARRSAWHVLDHAWEIEDRLT